MHADHGADEQELGDPVAITGGIDGVGEWLVETQIAGNRMGVKSKAGPCECTRTKRRPRRTPIPIS